MPHRLRSLKHEYDLYVEREVEDYKESVSRSVLLSIGDEAVANLAAQQQLALTELILCDEVDRIIGKRLRIPSYAPWRRRRLKALAKLRRPEHWGLLPDGALARALPTAKDGHVLVAGTREEGPTLYLAANGCEVTAIDAAEEMVERVINAAVDVGLASRIRGLVSDLRSWTPDLPLHAVVCTPAAFDGLSAGDRAHAIALLQTATTDGGVHLVQTMSEGARAFSVEELEARYGGWAISVESGLGNSEAFLARKAIA
jgi:hypothetical protein